MRGCQEGKRKAPRIGAGRRRRGKRGLVSLDIVNKFDHRVQRSLSLASSQSPTVAESNERVGDPNTGVGLPDFNINNGETAEDGNNQSAQAMPIWFGNVRPDQKFIIQRTDDVFVRRGRLFRARHDPHQFGIPLEPFDFD